MDSISIQAGTTLNSLLGCQGTEKLTDGYDKVALDYDMFAVSLSWEGPDQTTNKLLEVETNKNARIIDVGCGTGLVGKSMWDAGYRNLYGVDLSKNSVNIASEKGVYSKLIHSPFGPATPLSYQDGYFDVAVSTGCFLPNHLDESHLPEMIRLVKQGGYLIIVTRKMAFENEKEGMKLQTSLHHLVKEEVLQKISQEEIPYTKNHTGVALCYQVI